MLDIFYQSKGYMGGGYGLRTHNGDIVVPAGFSDITKLSNGFFKTEANSRVGLINPQGVVILRCSFKDIYINKYGEMVARNENYEYTYLNKFGMPITYKFYKVISKIVNGRFGALNGDSKTWTLININGEIIADGIKDFGVGDLMDYDSKTHLALFSYENAYNSTDDTYFSGSCLCGPKGKIIGGCDYCENLASLLNVLLVEPIYANDFLKLDNLELIIDQVIEFKKNKCKFDIEKTTSQEQINKLIETLKSEINYLNALKEKSKQALQEQKIQTESLNKSKKSAIEDIFDL